METLIAGSLLTIVMATLAVAMRTFQSSVTFTGSEVINGESIPINPADTITSNARLLLTEVVALTPDVSYTVCADRPLSAESGASTQWLPVLARQTSATLRDPAAVTSILAAGGVGLGTEGYSLLFIGKDNRLTGALSVTVSNGSTAREAFRIYTVHLFGDYGTGYGRLLTYIFASPQQYAQPVTQPVLVDGCWRFSLPDPTLPSEAPDAAFPLVSSISYAFPSML